MSANTLSNTVIAETKVKAPRVKKPTLSAKYSKFLVFGYGLIQSLQSQGVLNDEGVETAYGELKLLSSIDDQTQFYESVLDQSKETGKVLRKYVAQRLAPPKEEVKEEVKEAEKKTKEEVKEEEASDDEEIHTQEIDINRKTYLIDDDNNLYSCVTHEEVGKYDPESKAIIPL